MTAREEVLEEAARLISHDRNVTYGPPSQDFERIAAMWSVLFGREFSAHEVAMGLICLKLSRLVHSPLHRDNWVDMAGYAACGFEASS